jgi:selenocysteine lyase/cysteine desulfurase
VGVFSSRKIALACERNLAFLAIVGQDRPDFRTISDFRKLHLEAFKDVFGQVVRLAAEAGLVKLGNVATDGTKIQGNASRHKAMSYGYMQKAVERLREDIAALVTQAYQQDAADDAALGSRREDELPAELARREDRLARIEAAMRRLEAQAKAEAEAERQRRADAEAERVVIGNQVSTFTALVASALPDGARVLAAKEDFTSVLFPFLVHADRGVHVRTVPLAGLVEAIGPGVDLVAVSAVQSADGRLVPGGLEALASAAARHGCLTYVDATQAVGWLPFSADRFDFVSCAAYKWLVSPRGTAFGVVRPERFQMLRPLYAGWYAGDDPWTSIYGPPLRLANAARRLDISPAWLAWVGTVPALELLAEVGIASIHRHNLALANALQGRLGLPPGDSAIVTAATEGGLERLQAMGIHASARAGNVRLSFHLHNTEADVEAVAHALGR